MRRNFLLFLIYFVCINPVFADQTVSQYLTVTTSEAKSIVTSGGNTTTTINVNTGALSAALTPTFLITTNSDDEQKLTLSAVADTQNGSINAIFNISDVKYIVLTNSTVPPTSDSVTDIENGNPTAANNPNVIAYSINAPATTSGQLSAAYNTINKNWDLSLMNQGTIVTSITIPAENPLNNTYSFNDLAGTYQATITLSFN
jgi:hypothetical protein